MKPTNSILHFLGLNTQGDVGPWTFYTSKRNGLVFFAKAPPLEPPSRKQIHQRNKFRLIANVWRSLSPTQRATWLAAAQAAHLRITGYNFFLYYLMTRDAAAVRTVERLAHKSLLPLNRPT